MTAPATASISDALDRLGLPGSLHGIGPLAPGQQASGPVYTVLYEPVDADGGTVGDFLDDIPEGSVVLIDNLGRTDCTVWGGIMTRIAGARKIAGTVIHGVCRDSAIALDEGYPIWSSGRFMRTGKDRVRVAAVQIPLTIDGVTIQPGDVLFGDEDGVVVVPAERVEEVLAIASHIEKVEDAIVADVQAGAKLLDARATHGYHSLQTREETA